MVLGGVGCVFCYFFGLATFFASYRVYVLLGGSFSLIVRIFWYLAILRGGSSSLEVPSPSLCYLVEDVGVCGGSSFFRVFRYFLTVSSASTQEGGHVFYLCVAVCLVFSFWGPVVASFYCGFARGLSFLFLGRGV